MLKKVALVFVITFCAHAAYGIGADCDCLGWWKRIFNDSTYIALRSNLLADAALVPNAGVEVGLGSHCTALAQWEYSWWSKSRLHRYWRIYGGNAEVRWYFEKNLFRGHHLGVYGQMLTYDFEFGGRGRLAPRWSWAAGVAYGYSFALNRNLNLDLTIGIGYLGGKYMKYVPCQGQYVWCSTHRSKYFGPTRAEVALVWLLGRKNQLER